MRTLLEEILEIRSATYADQDEALWKERADAARRRDDKRVAEIDETMAQKREQAANSQLAELRKRHDDADSQKLIDAATPYVLEMFDPVNEEDFVEPEENEFSPGEKSLIEVRALLGARPDEPVLQPLPGEEAASVTAAWATRIGESLNITVSVPRSADEIAAIVDWLCAHEGTDLHYDIWGLTNEFGNFEGPEDFKE
jgi:hypothetical protein